MIVIILYKTHFGFSSANSSHCRDCQTAERSDWPCCPGHLVQWWWTHAFSTPESGTHRCWGLEIQSAPWYGHDAQSGKGDIFNDLKVYIQKRKLNVIPAKFLPQFELCDWHSIEGHHPFRHCQDRNSIQTPHLTLASDSAAESYCVEPAGKRIEKIQLVWRSGGILPSL